MSLYNEVYGCGGGQDLSYSVDQNDVELIHTEIHLAPTSDNLNITGIQPPAYERGLIMVIVNDTSYNVILTHNDSNSSALNRFQFSDSLDYTLPAYQSMEFSYNTKSGREGWWPRH